MKEVKADLIPVSLESQSFTKFSFASIEQYMENYVLSQVPMINKDIRGVPRNAILNASESYQLLSDQKFDLGDRVEYVQDFGKVPIMSKGTVVSIITVGSKTSLGVIFDVPQLSGNNMNGKLQTNRGLSLDSSLVLNLSNKQFVYHSKASKQRKVISEEEKVARIKAAQAKKLSKPQPRAPSDEKNKASNPLSASAQANEKVEPKSKGSNELLSLLRKKQSDESNDSSKATKIAAESQDEQNQMHNPQAAKQIYSQIFSNVMSEGNHPVNGDITLQVLKMVLNTANQSLLLLMDSHQVLTTSNLLIQPHHLPLHLNTPSLNNQHPDLRVVLLLNRVVKIDNPMLLIDF